MLYQIEKEWKELNDPLTNLRKEIVFLEEVIYNLFNYKIFFYIIYNF